MRLLISTRGCSESWSKKERRNGLVVSKSEPLSNCAEDREGGSNRESPGAACQAGRHVCAHCQPVPLGNLGVEGRRRSKWQKYHGADDACCRARLKAPHSLRGSGCGKSNGRTGGAGQRKVQRRLSLRRA